MGLYDDIDLKHAKQDGIVIGALVASVVWIVIDFAIVCLFV